MQAVHWTNGDQIILKNNTCVAFFGKVRIPTIGHQKLINEAKNLSNELDCSLCVGISSAISEPFDIEQKKYFAEHLFRVPVQTYSNLIKFFSSISEAHDELHLVAGSDRANEYRKILTRYNGTPDSSGRVLFEFKKWKVHEFKRKDVLSPNTLNERVQDVSSTKLETLIQENKYNEFKAYYPGIQLAFVRELFTEARKKNLSEGIEIPDIGHTFSRDLMPQITGDCLKDFLKYLDRKDIDYSKEKIDPSQLKSTQSEFDEPKIVSLMYNPSKEPIVVSNDDHVIDGHHRWLADFNTNKDSNSIRVDLPALELYRTAKEYCGALNESVDHKKFGPMVDGFVSFASEKLGIKSLPNVQLGQGEYSDQPSFASYAPDSKSIRVVTLNRHPMDILRSLAHELVHHKQNEDGRIKNIAREGSTGSPIEDEANSMAGRLMRWYGKENPTHFKLPGLTEAIFVVGLNVEHATKAMNINENYQEINIHNLPYTEIYSDSLIIPASIDESRSIRKAKELLETNGFVTRLLFIKSAQKILSEGIKFTKTDKENESMKRLRELFSSENTIVVQEGKSNKENLQEAAIKKQHISRQISGALKQKGGKSYKGYQKHLERMYDKSVENKDKDSTNVIMYSARQMAASAKRNPASDYTPATDSPETLVKQMTKKALKKPRTGLGPTVKRSLSKPLPPTDNKTSDMEAIQRIKTSKQSFIDSQAKPKPAIKPYHARVLDSALEPHDREPTFREIIHHFNKTGEYDKKEGFAALKRDHQRAKSLGVLHPSLIRNTHSDNKFIAKQISRLASGKPESKIRNAIKIIRDKVAKSLDDREQDRYLRGRDRSDLRQQHGTIKGSIKGIKKYGIFEEENIEKNHTPK